jgi:hypothetical protein
VEHPPSCRIAAFAVAAILILSGGCRTFSGGGEKPPDPVRSDCLPLKIDRATSETWTEALRAFIVQRQVERGCVLVRKDECYQDPPASVLDGLRKLEDRLKSWSFLCGDGVTVLTLRDEVESGRRVISVSDGFNVTCRWSIRRTWFPGQSRVKAEGCGAVDD